MWYASHKVQICRSISSQCEKMASADYWQEIPDEYINFNFKTKDRDVSKPLWKLATDDSEHLKTREKYADYNLKFQRFSNLPIYFFYRLDKFHAHSPSLCKVVQ